MTILIVWICLVILMYILIKNFKNNAQFFTRLLYFFIMKLCTNQSIPCEFLKGACIFLSDEDEGRYIKDVCVDLEKHLIILIDDDGNGYDWESLRNASIQFQGGR